MRGFASAAVRRLACFVRPHGNPLMPTVQGSPVKAVLAGLAIDLGGSFLVSLFIAASAGLLSSGGLDVETARVSPWVFLAGNINVVLAAVAGYVCARIAKRAELRLTLIMATFSLLVQFYAYAMPISAPARVVGALLEYGLALVGAWLGRAANRRSSRRAA